MRKRTKGKWKDNGAQGPTNKYECTMDQEHCTSTYSDPGNDVTRARRASG